MRRFFAYKRTRNALLVLLFGGVVFLSASFFFIHDGMRVYPELGEIQNFSSKDARFSTIAAYFQKVAEKKGGVYAFEVLKRAELPSNIDVHLLGHIVGDELYRQVGIHGMESCTHDFRNACSHTIVIGALLEFGEGALPQVREACDRAPGGKGAYTMCFHGFGHGVLAFNEYDFPRTVALCQKTGTEAYHNREYVECVGGAVMELLGGGGHDQVLWLEKRREYLSDTNPLSLCEETFLPDEVRPICYTYLTPHLFGFDGGDVGRPGVQEYTKAFSYCDAIPSEQKNERRACFGGLGKEFVVLAKDRDVRNFESMTNQELQKVSTWCMLADRKDAIDACLVDAVQSLFWGGENNRNVAERFCSLISDEAYQDVCTNELITAVSFYIDDPVYRETFCNELAERSQKMCHTILHL